MRICLQCNQKNPDQAKFCSHCGSNLTRIKTSDQTDSAERRQLTILFCDLVDSTPLSERMDPEDYRQMILDYHEVAEEVIDHNGGNVGNYLGDGLLVYFGYPDGLENAAILGVKTGLDIIKAMGQVKKKWETRDDIYIKVRVGIHTGIVIVDDHLALGETVNIAARLEGLAPQNGLVISPQTYHLIKGWFEVKSIGKKLLKGITEPIEIFEVLKESGVKTSLDISKKKGLSPLVGRKKELDQLREQWMKIKNGNQLNTMIVGEAGIGKSRLVDNLEEEIRKDPDGLILEARCATYHMNSAFHPLFEMVQNDLLYINKKDTNKDKIDKLEGFLQSRSFDSELLMPLLAEYMGIASAQFTPLAMSPFAKRQKIMEVISLILVDLAQDKNILLIIEDLHWIDASTLEWIQFFMNQQNKCSLLLLVTTRPSLRHDLNKLPDFTCIKLSRLTSKDMEKMCLYCSNGKELPAQILSKILEKTEGIPLFVEELTKMVLDSDQLIEKKDHFELTGSISAIDIPSTLQDSLLARLDQLKDVKDIVQVGSVIGREFSLNILKAVLHKEKSSIEDGLSKLLDAELLQTVENGHQADFRFKHALIQDTAYGSMLRNRRQYIHRMVAEVLEQQFKEVWKSKPELLAYHLTEANSPLKAIPQWLSAGQIASKTNAGREAIAHLKQGLELLPNITDESERNNLELDFTLTLGGTYVVSHGFPHPIVKETFDRARDIAQNMEVSPKLAIIQFNLLSYYFNTEAYESFNNLAEHMMTMTNDPESGYWFKLLSTHLKAGAAVTKGHFQEANRHFHEVLDMFDPSLPFPWEITPSGYLPFAAKGWWMFCLQISGSFDKAKRLSEEQLNYSGKEHQDSTSLYHLYTFPALYSLQARDWIASQKIIERYLPIARSFGDPVFTLTAEVYYHLARALQGDHDSFNTSVQLINVCFDIGFRAFAVCMSAFIAEGYLKTCDYKSGLDWIEKILNHVKQTGTHIQTAELHRLKGRMLQALGKQDNLVEKQFKKALNIARDQSARTFEIRSAMDIALLWHQQGKSKKAYGLLKKHLDKFNEDFESIDLKEALQLLHKFKV